MTLRNLAKDYANGVIGPQAYRKARNDLIEGILSGRIKVSAHDFQAPLNLQRIESEADITAFRGKPGNKATPKPVAAKQETREEVTPPTSFTNRGLLAGIAIIIACLVILVALYPFTRQKTPIFDTASESTMPGAGNQPESQQPVVPGAGEILIKQFLQQNDWTDENLQQFSNQWQELSAGEQDAALSSPARTQLANAIHRKLVEEQVMLSLGELQKSIDRQTVLINFARQAGISDPRLILKETP